MGLSTSMAWIIDVTQNRKQNTAQFGNQVTTYKCSYHFDANKKLYH